MPLKEKSPEFLDCRDENSFQKSEDTSLLQPQESHPEREILLILSGESVFTFNGKSVQCTPGSAFFINSNIPHQLGYRNINSDVTHIWIHLHPKRFFAMLYRISAASPLRSCRSWEFSLPMLEFINARWDLALHSPPEVRLQIYRSIARIIAEEIDFLPDVSLSPVAEQYDIVNWMKKHISLNCGANSSMEELEKLTGYNRCYLMRKFKNSCGITVGEYINTVRRAFVAGAAGRMTQKEIAARLGFKSAAAFWLWQSRDRKKGVSGKKTN
jgi:AraC-like DNA-binding protein